MECLEFLSGASHINIQHSFIQHSHMDWFLLVIAGLLEVGWAIGLKKSEGFTQPLWSVLTIIGIVLSMFLLGVAARTLPIGTAYGVWVGIGAVGTAILGIVLFDENASAMRITFLALMIVSLVGLKVTAH